jgi:hypothetical protein
MRPIAIAKGYLVNRETGKGKCARIALGGPMPNDVEILLHPDIDAGPLIGLGGAAYLLPVKPYGWSSAEDG